MVSPFSLRFGLFSAILLLSKERGWMQWAKAECNLVWAHTIGIVEKSCAKPNHISIAVCR